jgi:excinuclease ABC subunit A
LDFFSAVPALKRKIEMLHYVGLSYVKLGQPSTELSGGEAQRVKLATELCRRPTGKTMYILDEPTTGLHFEDVNKLVAILQRLTDGGNSVLVIEHNLDVIKCADYLIDMGPEGGDGGGRVVAEGTPEELAQVPESYTGKYVKESLEAARR